MIIIIAIVSFVIVLTLFVIDVSKDQLITSESSSYAGPFESETMVRHNYNASPQLIWKTLTQLSDYNYWFPGVARILPVVETKRYVHKYSFDQFKFVPGAYIRIRPFSLSPTFMGRITSIEKNKKLEMEFRYNPFHKETVRFDILAMTQGSTLTCKRTSKGLFSWLTVVGFENTKSAILDNLGYFIPEEQIKLSTKVAHEISKPPAETPNLGYANKEDLIAYLVNTSLDGNDEPMKATHDKVIRGKAKAMIIKINRGSLERPAMPETGIAATPTIAATSTTPVKNVSENNENNINRLIADGLEGKMDEINALDNKVLRGKIKAGIVKAKRK